MSQTQTEAVAIEPTDDQLREAAETLTRCDSSWLDDFCGRCRHCDRNSLYRDPLSIDCVKSDLVLDDEAVYEAAARQAEIDADPQWDDPGTLALLAAIGGALSGSQKPSAEDAVSASAARMAESVNKIISALENFRDAAIETVSGGQNGAAA